MRQSKGVFVICIVKADTMTFNCPLLPAKEIKIYEITSVEYIENRLTGYGEKKALVAYSNKKKMFEIFDDVIGFQSLYYHFYQRGKIVRGELKEEFSVNNINGGFWRTSVVCEFERLNEYLTVRRNRSDEMVEFGNINACVNHGAVPPFHKV